jgi:hypothetical protein
MKLIIRVLCGVALLASCAAPAAADTFVNGYYRSNGTYVAPHMRSDPDGNPYNNWSTKGNVNPYTGQLGTKNPYSLGSSGSSLYSPYPAPSSNNYSSGSLFDDK